MLAESRTSFVPDLFTENARPGDVGNGRRLQPDAFAARAPGTGATVNPGLPAVRSEVHLSGDTVNDQPNGEFSTWSIERLEAPPATLARGSKGPGTAD